MVRKKIEPVSAARQKQLREEEALRESFLCSPRNVGMYLGQMAAAQRAVCVCAERGTTNGVEVLAPNLPAFIRNCPDRVNPFAAPAFFSMLFMLWRDLRQDPFGTARNRRSVVRRQFEEILAAIHETVPRVRKGRAPVGPFEKDQRRQTEEKAGQLAPMLRRVLERVGRPSDYSTPTGLEDAICQRVPGASNPREVAEALWHYRTKRGTPPILKVARRLAEVLLEHPPVSELLEDTPAQKRAAKS